METEKESLLILSGKHALACFSDLPTIQSYIQQKKPKYDSANILHITSPHGYTDLAMFLILRDGMGESNQLYSDKEIALRVTAEAGCTGMVESLLTDGVDPNAQNKYMQTALHLAAENNCIETVRILLAAGANPNIKNSRGRTALHLATLNAETAMVSLLLEAGADPNIKARKGGTPLHMAAMDADMEKVRILLEKDADPTLKDGYGETAAKIATESHFCPELAKTLSDAIDHWHDKQRIAFLSCINNPASSLYSFFGYHRKKRISYHQLCEPHLINEIFKFAKIAS